jgi:alanyl-tRNA synthetase
VTILISDGILPANDGRGYVLRRLIRRAYRHGTYLDLDDPFLYKLVGVVTDVMKDAYPELLSSSNYVAKICLSEEKRFASTLSSGMRTFQQFIQETQKHNKKILEGTKLFKLYDTFGFPLELSRDLAKEKGLEVDEKGFHEELEKQRQKARSAWQGDAKEEERQAFQKIKNLTVQFEGYAQEKISGAEVIAVLKQNKQVDQIEAGEKGEVVLDKTPFYAEAGGQVSDTGVMKSPHLSAVVESAYYPIPNIISQKIKVLSGKICVGDVVDAEIDSQRRRDLTRNHTATHLLHATLRVILGDHIKQSGSLVAPERLRFDFTHFSALDTAELEQIEAIVNEKIRDNMAVSTALVSLEEGLEKGAIAIFEEKYGETVRLVSIDDFSKELCGGVHVKATGEIGIFKLLSESSIAAGMRRIEAVTGDYALQHIQESQKILHDLQSSLKVSKSEILNHLEKIQSMAKNSEKENKALRQKLANMTFQSKEEEIIKIKDIPVLVKTAKGLSQGELRELSDSLKQKIGTGIIILGMRQDKKAFMTAAVSKDLTSRIKADEIIKALAPIIGGGGGGRPDFAQAGGTSPDGLDRALKECLVILKKLIT